MTAIVGTLLGLGLLARPRFNNNQGPAGPAGPVGWPDIISTEVMEVQSPAMAAPSIGLKQKVFTGLFTPPAGTKACIFTWTDYFVVGNPALVPGGVDIESYIDDVYMGGVWDPFNIGVYFVSLDAAAKAADLLRVRVSATWLRA